jgi:hypothetical protein
MLHGRTCPTTVVAKVLIGVRPHARCGDAAMVIAAATSCMPASSVPQNLGGLTTRNIAENQMRVKCLFEIPEEDFYNLRILSCRYCLREAIIFCE